MDMNLFDRQLNNHLQMIRLSPKEEADRENLLNYLRDKLKNKNIDDPDQDQVLDTGLSLEVYGSYASGLSWKGSDLDLRVNDMYTYRFINLEVISKCFTYLPYSLRAQQGENKQWTGPNRKYISRIREIEFIRHARVPVLKMVDTHTGIEFDVTTGASFVNRRHLHICKKAQAKYSGLKNLVLLMKSYLKKRDCANSFTGGISSFLLFYMVLAYF